MADPYDGFSNYETWCVYSWLLKATGTQQALCDYVAHLNKDASATDRRDSDAGDFVVEKLSEKIRNDIERGYPLADFFSVYSDLLQGAIKKVRWREIAHAFCEDLRVT